MNLIKNSYGIIKKLANATGYDLQISKKANGSSLPYEHISTASQYAPWLSDKTFNDTFNIIKNYTLVDKYRCYELWN